MRLKLLPVIAFAQRGSILRNAIFCSGTVLKWSKQEGSAAYTSVNFPQLSDD